MEGVHKQQRIKPWNWAMVLGQKPGAHSTTGWEFQFYPICNFRVLEQQNYAAINLLYFDNVLSWEKFPSVFKVKLKDIIHFHQELY